MISMPTLDKGFVELYSFSISQTQFRELVKKCTNNKITNKILQHPSITLYIKCPLFVQLFLSEFSFNILTNKYINIEAYSPSIEEIGCQLLEENKAIKESIDNTTEVVLLNNKSYQQENCDAFIAQINLPINMYNNIYVTGSLAQWCEVIKLSGLPKPIEQYRQCIEDIIKSEWNEVYTYCAQEKRK